MKNSVELLRAICFTKDDMKNITNLADSFTEKEIEFMVEFKKIYELGTGQLKIFIDKLDEEGSELDSYSIQYYVDVLTHGPLGSYVLELSKDKKYFVNTPDAIGILGNKNKSPQNITVFSTDAYPLGCAVDTYNKLPSFMQVGLTNSIKQTEDVFRTSLRSSNEIDNTLPIADKAPQLRHDEEPSGLWGMRSNGSYMTKDTYYYQVISDISQELYEKIKTQLGDEDFRMFGDKKEYSAFDSDKNQSTAINNKIVKNVTDGEISQKVDLDLMGDVFDSEEKRATSLKITNTSKDVEYLLNTVTGQLGV